MFAILFLLPVPPGGVVRIPQAVEKFVVAEGVHALPETVVLEQHHLAPVGQVAHGFLFQHQILVIADEIEQPLVTDEKAARDTAAGSLRLFVEFGNLSVVGAFDLTEAARRADAGNR